jgi:hypothetical protein
MNKLLRYVRGLALLTGILTAPWAALAAYNLVQNDNASTGFLDQVSRSGIQIFTFLPNNRIERMVGVNGTGATSWSFDEKEYTLFFADLGTASSAVFSIPTTGIITQVDLLWPAALAGSSAVLTMNCAARTVTSFQQSATNVAAFSLTATTTPIGGRVSDDTIFKAVNMGDMCGWGTDGGPSNAVPGTLTVHIRPAN